MRRYFSVFSLGPSIGSTKYATRRKCLPIYGNSAPSLSRKPVAAGDLIKVSQNRDNVESLTCSCSMRFRTYDGFEHLRVVVARNNSTNLGRFNLDFDGQQSNQPLAFGHCEDSIAAEKGDHFTSLDGSSHRKSRSNEKDFAGGSYHATKGSLACYWTYNAENLRSLAVTTSSHERLHCGCRVWRSCLVSNWIFRIVDWD